MLSKVIFALTLLSSFPFHSFASEKLIPLEHFVKEDEYSQPRLSPDGKYIALTARTPVNGRDVPLIVVYSLPDMKEQSATRMPLYEVPLGYTWVSNTRLLISKGKEIGSREAPSQTGEIFAMDFNGENQEYLYGYNIYKSSRRNVIVSEHYGTGIINSTPNEKNGRFFMTAQMWRSERTMLYDVDSKNASRKLIASLALPQADFLIQHNGTPRFAYGTDKEGFSIVLRYNEKTDDWKQLPSEKTGTTYTPFAFSPDDSEFYALYSKNGEPSTLIKENTTTGERATILKDDVGSINNILFGSTKELPFAAGTNIGIPKIAYLNANRVDAKLHQLLSSKFPNQLVNFVNYTDDGRKLLFSVTSDKEPGAYFIFDQTSNRAYPLFNRKQAIDPDQMSERRPIKYKSRDGIDINGYITIPKSQDFTKKMPLVVLPHGGPHGISDGWEYDNDAQFLASRGYAVLQVNFRGSGSKGHNFMTSGYKKWGSDIMNDIIDGVQWAIAESNVDANRICTYGVSFGGYSALMLPVREPNMFKCAIGYAGVYDLNLLYKSDEADDSRFSSAIARYVGRNKEELDLFSPAKHAEKITIPVMLVHGKEDKRATFNHALAMRDALIKVNRPPEWMAVEDEGHGFYNTKNVTEFYQRLEAFLAKYIGQ